MTIGPTVLTNYGSATTDVFVAKINSTGGIVWVRRGRERGGSDEGLGYSEYMTAGKKFGNTVCGASDQHAVMRICMHE